MIEKIQGGAYLVNGETLVTDESALGAMGIHTTKEEAKNNTMAWSILSAHNTSGNDAQLKIRFDAMASHDITYVGIIQTARASGLTEFPLPYVLTNCHNSLMRSAVRSTRMTMSSVSLPQRNTAVISFRHISPSFTPICVK